MKRRKETTGDARSPLLRKKRNRNPRCTAVGQDGARERVAKPRTATLRPADI